MTRNALPAGNGLTSLTPGFSTLGDVETWRPRRIAIAGVRFQSGGDTTIVTGTEAADKAAADKVVADKAASDKAAADAQALANKGKTPEQIASEKAAADKKTADDAAAKKVADDKAAADKAAADKKSKADGSGQSKAPEKYALVVPDEAKEFVDAEDLKDLETIARENDWTQEEAQAYLDGQLERTATRLEKQRETWKTETAADPDYGGAHLADTTAQARKAVNAIRPEGHPRREAFLRFLNRGGAGNHIEVVSFLADFAKLLGEDTPNLGSVRRAADKAKSDAEVMFPSSAGSKAP